MKIKAGRSSYGRGDASVTTARSARSRNCYKKARKWDRVRRVPNRFGGMRDLAFFRGDIRDLS